MRREVLTRLGPRVIAAIMKRKSAPKPVVPPTDLIARLAGLGRGVLFAHLLLTPLLFTQATIEHFEFVKFLGLITTALMLLAIGAITLPYLRWNEIRDELGQPLLLAGLAFVASSLLSTIASADGRTSFFGHHENYGGFVTILTWWLLFTAACILVRTSHQMQLMLFAVIFSAAGVTAYGLLQLAKLDPLVWSNASKIDGYVRPFSTMGHANFLGAWLVLAIPIVLMLARGRWRFALIGLAAAMGLLLVMTMSRGAWLGVIIAAIVALCFLQRNKSRFRTQTLVIAGGVSVCVLLGLLLFNESIRVVVLSRSKQFLNDAGRMEIWSAAGAMFAERPVLGTGPDTFHHHCGRHCGVAFWEHSWGFTPTRAHNEFLHIAATQGVVGILAAVCILMALVISFRRAWRLHSEQRRLLTAIAASISGFFVTEMFGFTVIASGSLAVVASAMIARLAHQPIVQPPRMVTKVHWLWRFAQLGAVACCLLTFVHLVIDPLRADLNSSAASVARSPSEATRLHQEAVRLCPRAPLYWNRYAGFMEERGRWEHDAAVRESSYRAAEFAFLNATRREPGNGYHWAGLGRTRAELAKLGKADPQSAYTAFEAALRCDPSIAFFYVDASQAALQLGDAERAAALVRAGLERYPSYGAMRKQAALLLLLRNRPLEALPEFDRALAADWKGETSERQVTAQIRDEVIRRIGGIR